MEAKRTGINEDDFCNSWEGNVFVNFAAEAMCSKTRTRAIQEQWWQNSITLPNIPTRWHVSHTTHPLQQSKVEWRKEEQHKIRYLGFSPFPLTNNIKALHYSTPVPMFRNANNDKTAIKRPKQANKKKFISWICIHSTTATNEKEKKNKWGGSKNEEKRCSNLKRPSYSHSHHHCFCAWKSYV